MEEEGAHVQLVEVDPEDGDSLEKSFDGVKRQHRRIDGVIQVDGEKREGPISRMGLSGIELAFRGSAMPARTIHEYLLRRRIVPDFVIYGSSTAAELAPANQGDHVAVSGYRNGLAELGQAMGLPAISVAWLGDGSGPPASPFALPMPASTGGSTLVISDQPYESRVRESIDRSPSPPWWKAWIEKSVCRRRNGCSISGGRNWTRPIWERTTTTLNRGGIRCWRCVCSAKFERSSGFPFRSPAWRAIPR